MIDDGMSDKERLAKALRNKRTAKGRANAAARLRANVGRIEPKLVAEMRADFEKDPLW